MGLTRQTARNIEAPQNEPIPVQGPVSNPYGGLPAYANAMGNAATQELIAQQAAAAAPGQAPAPVVAPTPTVAPTGAAVGPTDPKATAKTQNPDVYVAPEKAPTREQFVGDYKTYLSGRMAEIQKLPASERAARVEALLKQTEDVSSRLNGGSFTDLGKLNPNPEGKPGTAPAKGFVPPELIGSIRPFINMVETEQPGTSLSGDRKAEGSLYSGQDWNSRLGVPQYRTQSDNLATPEATCNVTSFSMALERLGYNRGDVQSAVERELKNKYLREQKRDPAKEDLSKVNLPPEYYGEAVRGYLDKNNGKNLKNYQKLRSRGTTDAERKGYAADFQANAQMEDNLDFLLHLNKIDRTTINGNASKILEKIEPDPNKRPEVITRSVSNKMPYADIKKEMDTNLMDGGAAIMSVRHKGKGKSGTHLISVQDATKDGVVVDDPYGKIRDEYRGNLAGDAYASPGKTRTNSGLANVKHNGSAGADATDWKLGAAQNPAADERRGESNTHSDAQMQSMVNYVTMFKRRDPTKVAAPTVPAKP